MDAIDIDLEAPPSRVDAIVDVRVIVPACGAISLAYPFVLGCKSGSPDTRLLGIMRPLIV